MKRLKILMSAYSCEPGQGSERGVGWNVVREVARHHEVWVLTRPDESGDAIRAELARNPEPNLHVIFFTLPFWVSGWRWGMGAIHLHYYLWQIQAYFVGRRLHREIGFDVAQHVTFVKHSSPSFLALLPIPLVWGPVGGGEAAPDAFWQDFSLRAKAYEVARSVARWVGELDPFVRLTARKSAVVRATTEDTAKRLYKLGVRDVQVLPGIGLPEDEITHLATYELPAAAPIRFISIGRLLHWKGFYLGLRAFAQANLPDAEYWVVGNGPEWDYLHRLANELGIADRVKFLGELPRDQALEKLGQCHVLVHPSLHDSGGGVCLEAMAAGRPVICLDLGGPAIQITPDVGFKVPAETPTQAVQDLAQAMVRLATDADLRQRMGEAAHQLVWEEHSWSVKGKRLAQVYEEIATTTSGTAIKVPSYQ